MIMLFSFEFFECIQVRSMSEAMAKTVGSLMNINRQAASACELFCLDLSQIQCWSPPCPRWLGEVHSREAWQ